MDVIKRTTQNTDAIQAINKAKEKELKPLLDNKAKLAKETTEEIENIDCSLKSLNKKLEKTHDAEPNKFKGFFIISFRVFVAFCIFVVVIGIFG